MVYFLTGERRIKDWFLASWDGTQWSALGAGFDNTVYDLAEYNGELYAVGAFESSGGAAMERIARWDGTD